MTLVPNEAPAASLSPEGRSLQLRPPTRLLYGVAASLLGRATGPLVNILLVPFGLKFLGVETIGLIGFYTAVLALVLVVDHAFSLFVIREAARLSLLTKTRDPPRSLLFTSQLVYGVLSVSIALTMTAFAPFIARNWLSSATLSFGTIETCLILAAWTIPSQLLCNLHVGVLTGLERLISANLVLVLVGLGRALVIVFAVLCISADARTFFAAQCAALAAGALLSGVLVWRETPAGHGLSVKPRFGIFAEAWRFNSLLIANAAAFVVATQSDKMLASGLLPLSVFGHYTLAATIASTPSVAVSALTMVLFPRFARLIAVGQDIRPLYHLSSQAVSIFLLPVWAVAFFFPQTLLMLWTGDAAAAAESSFVLPMLVSASILLTLNSVPNAVVLTGGWPQYPLIANVASLVSLPFAYWLTQRYGVLGPTFIPLALGILNFFLAPLLLGRRMLRSEQTRWFLVDVGLPFLASALGGLTLYWLLPTAQTPLWSFLQLGAIWSLLSLLATSAASRLRAEAVALVRQISRLRRGARQQQP